MSSLKKKTIHGFKWNAIEQVSVQGIRFVLGIILARLLLPEAYGITGLIAVFMAVSQVFINSGFGNALIQKKDRTDVDFATVFYFNMAVSVVCWIGLSLLRYWIADFFNEPLLIQITPVIGLNLIFNALALVQRTRLTVELDFKTQARASVFATIFSGLFGIYLAYNGYGVWALVFQSISKTFLNSIILWYSERWIPPLVFSKQSFVQLFSFGSKLLISGLLNTIYINVYTLVIGKFFSTTDLGYYNRANQFKNLPSQNITMTLKRVVFPVLSTIQEQEKKLQLTFQKIIKATVFIVTPIMLWLMILARPIIIVTIKEKWEPAVILLQILCLIGIVYPVHSLNLTVLQVKGRSDLFLKLEILKKVITTIVILSTFWISVKAMVIGSVIGSVFALFLNTYYTRKILDYGLIAQIRDFIPTAVLSLIMIISMTSSTLYIQNNLLKILVGTIVALITYLGFAYVFKIESFSDVRDIIKQIK